MVALVEKIIERAAKLDKTVVLPEGEDKRVVKAASEVAKKGFAKVILLGNAEEIKAANPDIDLSGVNILDPKTNEKTNEYAKLLFTLRQGKISKKTGLPEYAAEEDAKAAILKDYAMYGACMLKTGDVDGMVSGACHSTANTLRPGLQVVKTAPGLPLVSSCSVLFAPEGGHPLCEDGAFVFADTGLEQNPDPDKLAYIAFCAAKHCEVLLGVKPRVAFLSHSTKGSAKHPDVDKVVAAFNKFKEIAPDIDADGELQFDAAIVPSVGEFKAPGSKVAGHANVLIFPDLDAGNIGYKIAERLGGFMAVGPLCQGFAKPINDLSRGCKWEDVYVAVAVTALQTQIKW